MVITFLKSTSDMRSHNINLKISFWANHSSICEGYCLIGWPLCEIDTEHGILLNYENLDLLSENTDFTISTFSFLDLFFEFFSKILNYWKNQRLKSAGYSRILSATCKLFCCLQSHLLDINWIWLPSSHEKFMIPLNIP